MSLLFLNLVVWGVAVYSFKIALTGHLSRRLLAVTPESTLETAAMLFQDGNDLAASQITDEAYEFLSKLAKLRLFALTVILLELSVCAYFFHTDPRDPVAWFVIIKNLFIMVLFLRARNETASYDPIHALMRTPKWVVRWERVMHLFTGICLLVQLARINFA